MIPEKTHSIITRAFILALLAGWLSSCFEPEGEFFVPVDRPAFENIDINLADHYPSPIYIYKPTRLSYKTDQGNYQLIKIEGFLNGTSLYSVDNPSLIYIDPTKFASGAYVLKISATFTSYSETLASRLGMETETINKEYNVVIDLTPPQPVEITAIEPRQGTLYVQWNAPAKINFLHYNIHSYRRQGNGWSEVYMPTPWLVDAVKTEFRDTLYTGGDIMYRVDIIGHNFTRQGVQADTTFTTIEPIVQQTGDSKVQVSWAPSPFYNNISEIYFSSYNQPTQTFSAADAVSFEKAVFFGGAITCTYAAYAKYGGESHGGLIKLHIGEEFVFKTLDPQNYDPLVNFGDQEILISAASSPKQVVLVNSQEQIVERTVDLTPYYQYAPSVWASEHAQYGKTPDGNNFYLFMGTRAVRFDKDFNYVETIDFVPFNTDNNFFIAYGITMSNNNIASFQNFGGPYNLVDLENNTLFSTNYLSNSERAISANGKYYVENEIVYDISAGTLLQLKTISRTFPVSVSKLRFSNNSSHLYILYSDGDFSVLDLSTLTITWTMDLGGTPREGNFSVDPITGLCGVRIEDEFVVLDPVNQTILRRIKVAGSCSLYNNKIYSGRYKLSL